MTDAELRDQAVAELEQTTIGYINRKWTEPPAGTHWRAALDLLVQIGSTPPATAGTGLGLFRLGGRLVGTSHLTDDTYELVVASWSDLPTLATCKGASFAYQALPGAGAYNPMNITDPAGAATMVITGLKAHPGVEGVYVDNVNRANAAAVAAFLKVFSPAVRAAGFKLMGNVNGYLAGAGDNDNGVGDTNWIAQVGTLLDYVLEESWQQSRDGAFIPRLRGTDDYRKFWDQWQTVPAAAHKAGARFCGLTAGRTAATKDADQIYGRASLLTASDYRPGDVFFGGGLVADNYVANDPYDTAWTAAPSNPSVDPVAGTATLT